MEFTGERMILGAVDKELETEHLDRYRFAEQFVSGKTVLDAACGSGYGTKMLAGTAENVTGIDISKEAIEYAGMLYKADNISYVIGTVSDLPFPDMSFDVVVSFETIEHIDRDTQILFLDEIKRVIKREGILIISTPNKAVYDERGTNRFHVDELSYNEFKAVLEDRFNNVCFFSQKWEVCDLIIGSRSGRAEFEGMASPEKAEYLIAVCSDEVLSNISLQSSIGKDGKLSELINWAKDNDKRNTENNQHLRELDTQIEGFQIQITEKQNQLEVLNAQIAEKKQQVERMSECVDELVKNERRFIESIDSQTALIKEKDNLIEEMREKSDASDKEILELGEMIASLKETVSFQDNEIQKLRGELAKEKENRKESERKEESLLRETDGLRTTIARQNNELAELKESESALKEQAGKLQSTEDELNKLYSSRGYKLMLIIWKVRTVLFPPDSFRTLVLKMFWLFFRHPIRFLKAASFRRIRNFFHSIRNNGIIGTSQRMKDLVAGSSVPDESEKQTVVDTVQGGKKKPEYAPLAVPSSDSPIVSIVIPVFNQFDYTYSCIQSIIENSRGPQYEIIVADDCSTDLTQNIENLISGIRIIRNKTNLRFLRNCNSAAKEARGQYLLFLNNDTQVRENWLAPLVDLLDTHEEFGMVGSKLVYPEGRLQEAGGILWNDGSAWNYGHGADPASPEYNYVKEVDYISGASIMIRKSLWEEIGGFDDRFAPAYCEDSDLAFEVRKRGYKVVYQPLSVVIHFEGVSNGTDTNAGQKAYQIENQKKFYDKWKDVLEKEHNKNGVNPFLARERGIGRKILLMVDHYVPQYDKDAGSRTVYQYIRLFVENGYHVKFIGDNFYPHQPYTENLQQMGVEVLYGPYYASHWKEWLQENGINIGYAFLNRPHIAVNYIDEVRSYTHAEIVYYGHDLHFLREKREYELTKDPLKLEASNEWMRKELTLMRKADMAYYPSVIEIGEIHRIDSSIRAKAIPAYLYENIERRDYNASERNDLMFIGGFDHSPNVDAVKWLSRDIMPGLKKRMPGVKVYILGSNPPEEIKALESDDLIIVGFVTDEELDEFYRKSRLVIVPLRYGAGIKGKVVEAMRNGVPIVTTSTGAEGLVGAEEILSIADDADSFIEKTVSLYNDEGELSRRSEASYQYVEEQFSPRKAKEIITSEFDLE